MDVYVYKYGSKWSWKYATGTGQKLCNTKEEALELATVKAKERDGSVYLEQANGKFKKVKV